MKKIRKLNININSIISNLIYNMQFVQKKYWAALIIEDPFSNLTNTKKCLDNIAKRLLKEKNHFSYFNGSQIELIKDNISTNFNRQLYLIIHKDMDNTLQAYIGFADSTVIKKSIYETNQYQYVISKRINTIIV